ncbi:hypothetical protein CYY_008837 [Polysphondylium violaceum]|uniref:Uncharacterized protein n=1 Tax=Polysphondylium violaceum TaxID=133409 RepID=A0A8J4PMS7_9MYCE|nr:hypothetical protein CYY_008837 [Polysphondylium violaceum]
MHNQQTSPHCIYDLGKLLNDHVTFTNSLDQGGFDARTTGILVGNNGLPFDIMASFYNMDIYNPLQDYQFVEGRDWIDWTTKIPYKAVMEKKDPFKFPVFPHGVPYQNGMELEGVEFDKSCKREDASSQNTKLRKQGSGKVGLGTRIGAAFGAAAAGAGAGIAFVATQIGQGVEAGAVSAATAIGDGVVEGAKAWKDGADIIIQSLPKI